MFCCFNQTAAATFQGRHPDKSFVAAGRERAAAERAEEGGALEDEEAEGPPHAARDRQQRTRNTTEAEGGREGEKSCQFYFPLSEVSSDLSHPLIRTQFYFIRK